MWKSVYITVLTAITVNHLVSSCVDEKKEELAVCLKNTSVDAEVLCRETKENLTCVFKILNECPELKNSTFIEDHPHRSPNFHVTDLFNVNSSEEFCECFTAFSRAKKINVSSMGIYLQNATWEKIVNHQYMCGDVKTDILYVANSYSTCADYRENKLTQSPDAKVNSLYDKVNIKNAVLYIERHCSKKSNELTPESYNCYVKRAAWTSVRVCHNQARFLRDHNLQKCAMRICIEKEMSSCPTGKMAYFIDSVNVFSDITIETEPCSKGSSSAHMFATALTLVSAYLLSLTI